MSENPSATRAEMVLRLEGEVDGGSISYVLEEGRHTVGAGSDNDLVIASAGVSRRHALVEVSVDGVVVDDLASKNGTWLNRERIDRAEINEGDVIHFGRTPLEVRRVERGDVELAVAVDEQRAVGGEHLEARERDTATFSRNGSDESTRLVTLLEEAARSLIGTEKPDPRHALSVLRSGLEARGASLVEWDGCSEPVALGQVGEAVALGASAPASRAFSRAAETGKGTTAITSGRSRAEPWQAWAVAAGGGTLARGLVITGERPFHEPAPSVLELVLRLLVHTAPQPLVLDPALKPVEPPHLAFPEGYVVGSSTAMVELHEQLRSLAGGDIPVLIVGETGVGKEHIARILHASSLRGEGPFVAVNCAAVPSELLEAELFGIERGVATGVDARPGKLQLAEGGVLLLDEIGDMSKGLQAKLLRALQEMEVHPLGARVPVPIDVRVIAATNTNLERRMLDGEFRRDLYYRVAGIALRVPPLRERREDIPALVESFLKACAGEMGKPIRGVTVKALQALGEAPWPGNVRELKHEVRRLVYLCPAGSAIDSSMLSEAVLHPSTPLQPDPLDLDADLSLERRVAELERQLITLALARTRGNRSRAAKMLGISRNGLAMKIERHGLTEQ